MKRLLSAILILTMVFSLVPLAALPASAETYSGTCGDNLTWTLETETGVLTISGSGEMFDWYDGEAPWYSYRSSIKSINIGNSVTHIGGYAFESCDSLTSITIPNNVTSIGYWSFANCWSLTSITIPDSVTSIGTNAFDCTGYYIEASNWTDGVLYIGNHLIEARDTVSGVYPIATGTKTIADWAFHYCDQLTSVTIPDSVTSIGRNAFFDCRGLTSITIPDGVTSIAVYTFAHCTELTSVTIGNSVKTISVMAFGGCTNLTSVTIGSGVASIDTWAFDDCSSLTDVCYYGTTTDWSEIRIGGYNGSLTNATIHYLAEGLKIDTASLTLYEDIAVNFTASVPEGLTDPYMVIEMNGQSYTLQASREDDQGRLVFEFLNLTPDMMGDNIKATLYATTEGGQLVHFCKPEYSVKQYCTNVMAAYPDDQKLQTLLADMLVYGAATQRFTGHNADSLVTAGLDLSAASTFTNLTDTDQSTSETTDANIHWTGAGLECGSRMSMYFTLTTTVGDATSVSVTINGRTTVYEYADMMTDDPTVCRVVFRGISASEYGDVVTAVVKNSGTPVQTLTYSVNSYVRNKQEDTDVENLSQLVQAIYNYGASARSYAN